MQGRDSDWLGNDVPNAGAQAGESTAPKAELPELPDGASSDSASRPRRVLSLGGGDRTTRLLTLAIFGVVILWLVALLSALLFGNLSPATVPRTRLERDLTVAAYEVRAGTADAKTWASYADGLIEASQYNNARSVITAGLNSGLVEKSYLMVEAAKLQLATLDYTGCVKTCDQALAQADREMKDRRTTQENRGISSPESNQAPLSIQSALILKAQAQTALSKYKDAIKTYDRYLLSFPTDSDILTSRGLVKVKAKDAAGAKKDFLEALKYIPDYAPAKQGLAQIGAAR